MRFQLALDMKAHIVSLELGCADAQEAEALFVELDRQLDQSHIDLRILPLKGATAPRGTVQ